MHLYIPLLEKIHFSTFRKSYNEVRAKIISYFNLFTYVFGSTFPKG